jgi:apolipoprotein N-acyltransferase
MLKDTSPSRDAAVPQDCPRPGFSLVNPAKYHYCNDYLSGASASAFQPGSFMDALPKVISGLQTWKLAIIVAFAGALSVLAMAPFFLWPIMFFTFPVLIWALDAVNFRENGSDTPLQSYKRRLGRAALIGWAFGFGYFLVSIYWIGYAFFVDADRYAALMPFAVVSLPAGLAFFYAGAAVLGAAMWRRGYARLLAFVFAFFCAEAARGYLLTGFPWNLFGEALAANDPHMQMAAYIGVYGLTLAALFIFSAPAALLAAPAARYARLWSPAVFAVLALTASYAFGTYRLRQAAGEVEGTRIRIVQPNIPQTEKWKPENRGWIFDRVLSLTRHGTSGEGIAAFTHVIWPESSVPFLFAFNGQILSLDASNALATLLPASTSLIMGAERADGVLSPEGRYSFSRFFNSLFVLRGGAQITTIYDKAHLVPFGEYMPFSDTLSGIGLHAFSHRLDGFDSGSQHSPLIQTPRAPVFLPLICYEIIFPGRVENLEKRPQWLVNVTNDAWFGNSAGPHQHLHQARIRATEEGLPVMRAANTGISAVIDPFGRILAKLDLGKAGVIDHGLPQALPITFYEKTRLPVFIVLFLFPLQLYMVMVALTRSDGS